MMPRRARVLILATLSLVGFGCGKGLTVNLSANPDPADPGQSVTWTLTVRNDTQCETTGEIIDLPPPLPDTVGAFALILGFIPELDQFGAEEFCREFTTTMTSCPDELCIARHFEEAFGPQVAGALSAQAHEAIQQAQGPPQPAGSCLTLVNDSEGFAAFCAFDPLSPGETDMASHSDTAPNTGNRNPAQVAIAFAPAEGEDCRPGTEIDDGVWALAGCYPLVAAQPVPTLSPLVTLAGALVLLLTGLLGVRYLRRA
jgi:hypothetical protein